MTKEQADNAVRRRFVVKSVAGKPTVFDSCCKLDRDCRWHGGPIATFEYRHDARLFVAAKRRLISLYYQSTGFERASVIAKEAIREARRKAKSNAH